MKPNDNVTAFATVDLTETLNTLSTNSNKLVAIGACLGAAIIGLGYYIHKKAEEVDRLKEDLKDLREDYHHYVIDHSEYNPDKDDDAIWDDLD